MKFPFDFSISLVFRLVFPGMVLAIALMPLCKGWLLWLGHPVDVKILAPILAVMFGWLIVLADAPIYLLFEGRTGWFIPCVKRWFVSWEARRVANAVAKGNELAADNNEDGLEYDIETLDFPIGKDGEPYSAFPTRLGNLMTSFETYSKVAYGIDSIFYWYRLWVVLDKDLKAALDEIQAVADGALYVSFSLYCGSLIFALYAVGGWIIPLLPFKLFNLPYLSAPAWTAGLAVLLFSSGYCIYRLAVVQQRGVGEMYRSLFDQYRDKLGFASDAAAIAVTVGANRSEAISAKFKVASRFLRWHRIRPAGETDNYTPEAWASARKSRKP
jgi:hypothetical protein